MSPRLRPKFVIIVLWVISFISIASSAPVKTDVNSFAKEFISESPPPCPPATLKIQNPGFLCSTDDPVQLMLKIVGLSGDLTISWSGEAITTVDGWFDPKLGMPGGNKVYVQVVQDSCIYIDSLDVGILMKPIASFKLEGAPCEDSLLQIIFTGYAYASWNWHWNFAEAQTEVIEWPANYSAVWDKPGIYEMSLWIEKYSCTSDTFSLPVIIGQYLEPPQLTCVKEDYNSLEIAWNPVEGASEYLVTTSFGADTIAGNSFTLTQLPYGTAVDFEVTAFQHGGCGPSETSSIQCSTLKYIAPAVYVPNIFSPNNDGINDLIIVQSNAPITEVNKFSIFDRWGNIVFEDQHFLPNDPSHGWDGSFSGHFLNPAVYSYQAELSTVYQDKINVSGDITLIK